MKKTVVYVHGKGGSADESLHYNPLFKEYVVTGFDYKAQNPWEAKKEFSSYFASLFEKYESVILIANSIGAYFCLHSLPTFNFERVFLISPVVDMEKLIENMMTCSRISEKELEAKGEIPTSFGETLSWEYLSYVKRNPIEWNCPTSILFGKNDNMTSLKTIMDFAEKTGSKLTVMENGEHWFHTAEQMDFLDSWINYEQG